jgi:hypothetical protein
VFPEVGVQDVGIIGVELDAVRAGIGVHVQNLFPRCPAVAAAKHAAFAVRAIRAPHAGDIDGGWIGGVHDDAAHLAHVLEPDMGPALAAIHRLENAIAGAEIGTVQAFACADIDHIGMRRRHGDIAYRTSGCRIEDRAPGAAVIIGLPDPAIVDAHEEDIRLAGNPDGAHGTAGAKRPDKPVAQALIGLGTRRSVGASQSLRLAGACG